MKTIDIEKQKKLIKTAKKILNCILEAKKRIWNDEKSIRDWQSWWFASKGYYQKQIESQNPLLLNLKSIITK